MVKHNDNITSTKTSIKSRIMDLKQKQGQIRCNINLYILDVRQRQRQAFILPFLYHAN